VLLCHQVNAKAMNSLFSRHKILPTIQDDKVKLASGSSQKEYSIERYVLEILSEIYFIFKVHVNIIE
jgi:hypothetical protein